MYEIYYNLDRTGGRGCIPSTRGETNGVQLHVVVAGEPGAPVVVLLHGYPDFWYGWRAQLGSLVDAGFRVIVPDLRGTNLSDAPSGSDSYRISTVAADVCELIRSEGRESAHVVGHDFGGFVAWNVALRHPSIVDRLGVVNAPHPAAYRDALRSSPRQLAKSWYVWFYQVPILPEWILGRNDADGMVTVLEKSSSPGTFDDETIQRYRAAWRHNGVGPLIHWYRGFRRSERPPRNTVVQPTLVCWGEDDVGLVPSLATESVDYCETGQLRLFPDASHWVHHEREEVTEALLRHLA